MSIAAIAGLLFYFFYWSPVYRIKPLNLIPSNAAFILASGDPLESWETVSESKIWQHLKQNPNFEKITKTADHLDSMFRTNDWLDFIGNKEFLIAAHPVQDAYEYLYIMDLARVSYLQDIKYYLHSLLDENFRVTHRKFGGIEITELYNTVQKQTLYISFIENLVVVSLTPTLTESAILQYIQPPEKDIYFLEITDELGFGGLVRAYVNFNGFMTYLDQFANDNASLNLLKHTLRYAGFSLAVEDDALAFNGYLNINDTVNSYLRALYASGKGSHDFLKIVPATSSYFISLGFEDFPAFVEKLEQTLDNNPEQKRSYLENRALMESFLRVDLNKSFVSWVDNEIVLLQTRSKTKAGVEAYALLLKTTNPDSATVGLQRIREQIKRRTPVKIKSVDYKGHAIHYMAVKGFFKVFLGRLFDKFDKPYYSMVGDWVIFSNHPRTIKNIIDATETESTLFYDEDFQLHYDALSDQTSVYAYINTPEIFDDLHPLMETEEWATMTANDEYIKCFSRISLQLSPMQSGIFRSLFNVQFKDPSISNLPLHVLPARGSNQRLPEKASTWENKYMQALKDLDKITIPDLSQDDYKSRFENGNLQYEVKLKNGWKDGRFSSYFSNGQNQFKGRYKNDKKDGVWRVYDEDGNLLVKLRYENGVVISQ